MLLKECVNYEIMGCQNQDTQEIFSSSSGTLPSCISSFLVLHLWQTSLIYHGILSQWAGRQLRNPYCVMQNMETICYFLGSSTPCLPTNEKIKTHYKEIRPSGGRDGGSVSWPLGLCLFLLFSHKAHTTDSDYIKQCWITQWEQKKKKKESFCFLTFWLCHRKYPSLTMLGL